MICLRVHLNALKAVGNQTAEPRQLGQRSWSFSGHRSDFVLTFFFPPHTFFKSRTRDKTVLLQVGRGSIDLMGLKKKKIKTKLQGKRLTSAENHRSVVRVHPRHLI